MKSNAERVQEALAAAVAAAAASEGLVQKIRAAVSSPDPIQSNELRRWSLLASAVDDGLATIRDELADVKLEDEP